MNAKTAKKKNTKDQEAPKVGIVSLGCPKALVDTERILTQLRSEGYELTPSYDDANVVIVNTCGFLDSAKKESLEAIGEAMDEAAFDRVIDVNVKGLFFVTRAALPALRASRGNVVNVASESGVWGYALGTVYGASKGAVINLTRALAIELAPDVRVNSVGPGPVMTDMLRAQIDTAPDPAAHAAALDAWAPMGRVGRPEEIAAAILFLASDAAAFVTGANLRIDGGSTAGR